MKMVMWNLLVKANYKSLPLKIYIYLVITIMGFVLIPLNILFLWPLVHDQLKEDQVKIEQLEVQIMELQNFLRCHENIDEFMLETEKYNAQVKQLLPNEAKTGEFMGELAAIAEKNQLVIKGFKPKTLPKSGKGYEEISLELIIQGEYFPIMEFMKALQQTTRFNRLNNIKLNTTPHGLECCMNISIFYVTGRVD